MTVCPLLDEKMETKNEFHNTSVIKKMSDITKSRTILDGIVDSTDEEKNHRISLILKESREPEDTSESSETIKHPDEDVDTKPSHSYIALIAMAILSKPSRKVLLGDIYSYISENFPYYRSKDKSWRNSIRHNLSLNECFIKAGRSENGKGNYWAIHPANVEDFANGDFRRRRARRRVRKSHSALCTRYAPFPFQNHPFYRTIDPYLQSYYLTPFNLPHCVRKSNFPVENLIRASMDYIPSNIIECSPRSDNICQSALIRAGCQTSRIPYVPTSVSTQPAVITTNSITRSNDIPTESWQDTWRKLKAQFNQNQK